MKGPVIQHDSPFRHAQQLLIRQDSIASNYWQLPAKMFLFGFAKPRW